MSPTRQATTATTSTAKQNAHPASSSASTTSPSDMSRAQRKQSARSQSQSRGLLSRKSTKSAEQPGKTRSIHEGQGSVQEQNGDGKGKHRAESEPPQPVQEQPRPVFPVRSIIPDPLAELPAWYTTDADWAITSAAHFRKKYPIHNPVGPRYYRNHHLAPPSLDKRPPSFFSPSFPPMATSTDRLPDTAQMPGPSRSPSGSPLPTPSSSQTRVHDVRVRTRKTSQTAHDNVDMLDLSDPWGTNWHHQSPYDVGKGKDRAPDSPESPTAPDRPRRMSMTSGRRYRTTAPSPLSQSTSAVHLASEPLTTHPPRRLSKRRKTFRGLFGGGDHEHRPHMSRGGSFVSGHTDPQMLERKRSHVGSIAPPSLASSANSIAATDRSSKRQSVLGRLVKRFSVIRRSDTSKSMKNSFHSAGHSTESDTHHSVETPGSRRSQSPEKSPHVSREPNRRAPPTSEQDMYAPPRRESPPRDYETESVLSVDQRISTGKLTVANPDDSSSIAEEEERRDRFDTQPLREHNMPLSSSPEPIDYQPPQPPFIGHPIRGPLSVISEGETYMSSPGQAPAPSLKDSPVTPPTIPSLLSLPMRSAAMPMDRPPLSPTLPALPNSPSLPEIPTVHSVVSLVTPPPPAAPKPEPSLPPTPIASRSSTPKPEEKPQTEQQRVEPVIPSESPKPRSFDAPKISPVYQPAPSYVDSSSMARVSMIVNPPTPFSSSVTITSPAAAPATLAVPEDMHRSPAQGDLPTKDTKDASRKIRRQTETFKLVRTPSGHVETVGSSFVADGEHWHVVESPKEDKGSRRSRREREQSEEQEKPERRRSKRVEREGASEDSDPQRGEHYRVSSNGRGPSEVDASQHRSRDSKRRSSGHERRRSSREDQQADAMRATQTPVIYASRPHAPSSNTSTISGARGEPRASVMASTRPSSEFQSVADMNALKAKDAWEIERLWKGRSMIYAPEGTTASHSRHHISSDSRPSTIMSHDLHRASTIPSVGGEAVLSAYGSSHTTYMMSPYQGHPHAATYPQLPTSPRADRLANGVAPHPARYAPPSAHDLPPLGTSPPRTNPLPEPPRLSPYKPSPLPASLAGPANGASSPDFWNRYAGVTVTH